MLELDRDTHTYRWDGQAVPGFSEVMARVGTRSRDADSGLLGGWSSISGGEHAADEVAQDFGTAVHDAIAGQLLGDLEEYDPQLEPWLEAARLWRHDNGYPESLIHADGRPMVERSFYSAKHRFACTVDWICGQEYSRRAMLVDWKTGAEAKDKWLLQMAAYAQCVKENGAFGSVVAHVVRLTEKGYSDTFYSASDLRRGWNRFQSCLNVLRMG